MTLSYNNLGIGGFLDLLFGQVDQLTKTYVLPATGATFVAETNLERYNGVLGGLTADPIDNWDSYSLESQNGTGAVSSTGSTVGGGTQTWGLQYGSLQIINVEAPPLTGGLLENDRVRFELNTGPGSAWEALAPGGTLTQTITIRAQEAGGFLILPDLDGDIGSSTDTFTFTLSFKKDFLPSNQVVDGTESAQNMGIGFVDLQGDIIDGADGLNDLIYANGGNDTVNAGFGNDILYAGVGDDQFVGGAGDDLLYGGDGNDLQSAGDLGNDIIYGGAGHDILSGDAGADIVSGDIGDDALEGHLGADQLFGGDGNDYLAGGDVVNLATLASRTLNPTMANEDNASDSLFGGAGNDTILGNGGSDSLHGGDGNDYIIGGDAAAGGSGITLANIDAINMGAGNLRAGSETYSNANAVVGSQAIFDNVTTLDDGTAVSARLIVTNISNASLKVDLSYSATDANGILLNADNNSSMNGQTASFRIEFFRTDNGQSVTINPAIVFGDLDTGSGSEQLRINSGLINAGTLGGSGINLTYNAGSLTATGTVDASNYNTAATQVSTVFSPTSSVDFTLVSRGVNSGFTLAGADPTTFNYVQTFAGNPIDNDVIDGGLGDDIIYGGLGADAILGNVGNDLAYGGAGNDTVLGGDGQDTVYGDGTLTSTTGTRSFSYTNNFDGADALKGATQQLYGGAPGVTNILNSPDPDGEKEFVFVQGYSTAQEASLAIDPALTGVERISDMNFSFVMDMGSPSGSDHVDGLSINFGDMTTLPANKEYENGVSEGLAVRLDPLSNITEIRWNGAVISSASPNNLETRGEGTMQVSVTSAGVVSVTYAGDSSPYLVATIPGGQWSTVDQSGWKFGLAGRTGTNSGFIYADDISITSTVTGTPLVGVTAGDDLIDAGIGNDLVYGGAGNDTISGGEGNDSLFFNEGNDIVYGGTGDDLIDDVGGISPTTGSNLVYGDDGNDLIWDGAGNDTVFGGAGNDSMYGDNAGNDIVDGGAGNDALGGGVGSDTLIGGEGSDNFTGNDGDDDLVVGAGDYAAGNSGDDVFLVDQTLTGNAAITIVGGETGEDTTDLSNGSAGDVLDLRGLTDASVAYGGGNNEAGTATYQNANGQTVTINFSEIETVLFSNVTTPTAGPVDGTAAADVIGIGYVDGQGDQVDGTDGNSDLIIAGAGNDTIDGGTFADTMLGEGGDDRFVIGDIDGRVETTGGAFTGARVERQINTDINGYQSPPIMTVLDDGRIMYVWANNGLHDNTPTMELQGRIMNADGSPSTPQFSLGALKAVDGFDGYDWNNLDVDTLNNGNVLISYVVNTSDSTGQGAGFDYYDEPIFSIVQPTSTGVNIIAQDIKVQQTNAAHQHESPPIATVLADGRILFTWSENAPTDDTTSMKVSGRFFNQDGTPAGNDFQIGSWAVDGTDGYDVDNMAVTQLTGGNIVVSYLRNNAETGDDTPVFTILNSSGGVVVSDQVVEGSDTETQHTPWESAAKIVSLNDGRFMAVWANDGLSDDINTMTLEGRIFNANGTPATGDFRIGSTAVDGTDTFDVDNVTASVLSNGNVVIGYVETYATGANTQPMFSIINPSIAPGSAGFAVASDVLIPQSQSHPFTGAPVIQPIGNTGNFVAVFADGDGAFGHATGLEYRVFNSSGQPLTGDMRLTNNSVPTAVSGLDGFDWDNVSVVYNEVNNTFTVGWVNVDDGHGTGVASSAPISATTFVEAPLAVSEVNTDTAGNQSPPKMVVLDDGRVMYVWSNNALHDETTTMELQGRILNADGTAAGPQFSLGALKAIDGFDGYDWDNLDVDLLNNGNVLISYVVNTSDSTGQGAGFDYYDEPIFSIVQPTATGVNIIAQDVKVQQTNDTYDHESPPVTTVLADGRILFVWSENATADDTTTMKLSGRIFNQNGTPAGNDFQIGNVAIDGTDSADVDNLSVTELAGGNIVVSYARSNVETGYNEPVYTVLNSSGGVVFATAEVEGTDNESQLTVWESPATVVALDDGRFMAVWTNDGYSDDTNTMTIEGRIFNANGTPATGDFRIGNTAVDGSDSFDVDNLTVKTLPGGKVVVGYVDTYATGANTQPMFSIVDTSLAPGSAGFAVASDVLIPQSTTHPWSGAPVIEALGDSGYFVAVFAEGDAYSGGATGLEYRIFNSSGVPVTDDIRLTTSVANTAVSGHDGFDWDNVSIVYNPVNNSFSVGWVANNDGSGTGVATSGPIALGSLTGSTSAGVEVVVGGETNETIGDTLDLSTDPASLNIVYTGPEAGTVTEVGTNDVLMFSEIEKLVLGAGNDTVLGGTGNDIIDAGAGNDTVAAGDGNDKVDGGAGNDSLGGGNGNDSLGGGDGNDTLDGGAGTDTLVGGNGNDVLNGGDGDDDIVVGAGDTANGGSGDDVFTVNPALTGNAPITIVGGETVEDLSDPSNGGAGDVLDLRGLTNVIVTPTGPEAGTVTYTNAGGQTVTINYSEIETILRDPAGTVDGTAGSDTMNPGYTDPQGDQVDGTDGLNDTIAGGAGNDVIDAGLGDDTAAGGVGNDTVAGNVGNDSLAGEGGNDSLDGGTGNDTLDGGADADTLKGGIGADSLVGGDGTDTLDGGDGNDTLSGDAGSDTLAGGTGNDTIDGGLGDDDIAVGGADSATGGSGDDVFTLDPTDTAADLNATIAGGETGEDLTDPANGGAGDVLDLGAVTAPVTVTLNANPESGTVNGLDADGTPDITFSEIEKVILGAGSDTVAGGTSTGPINVDTGAGNDSIATGSGNDTIAAGTGNDSVDAGAGNDTVDAGTGDDTVDAGAGDDTVAAGDGNDKVDGGAGNDSLGGGNGNDSLGGGDGNDTLDGGAGTDTLVGGNGNDVLNGGDGDDDIVVGAGDVANGGSGDDVFTVNPALTGNAPITIVGGETVEDLSDPSNGGAGDVLDLRGLTNVIVTPTGPEAGTVTYTNAGGQTVTINYSEIETILRDPAGTVDGTAGSDTMNPGYTDPQGDQVDGTDGLNDTIAGGAGNDVIDAGLGDDTAAGGVGNDTVAGNVGNDSLAGEGGNDSLDGGTGNDTLDGGADADTLKGGIGADSLVGGDGTDTLDGGDGNDTLSGDAGSDTLAGGLGNDTIDGGLGDDDIAVGGADSATGGSGDDVFTLDPTDTAADLNATIAGGETGEDLTDPANGGAGDVLDLGAVTAPVTVTLNANPESGTVNGLDADGTPDITFSEIEKVITGTGSDTVAGGTSTGPINVDTGDGNDSIATGTGNDTIAAGTGNDSVDAGAGNDTVDAGTGDDTVDAGAGDDTVAAGDGNDKVDGGAGNDSLGGGNGNDSLGGGDGNDTLDGGAGTDTLAGGNGNDVLNGGDGDDDIVVGAGDTANGGSGDDVFTVNPALTGNAPITIVGGETVEDLSDPSNGGAGDVLDLRGLTNVIVTPTGPEAGTVTYTNAGGQTVTINYSEIETILRDPAGTVDGTAGSDTMNPGYTDPQGDQVDGTDGLNDTIAGGAGNDVIDAGLGDDTAAGGVGNDTVAGNVGNDSLAGEGGNDSLDGGTGNDTLDGGADADTLKGGIGADSLVGGDGTDTLDGGDGNDTLSGDAGSDTLAGGLGNDTIDGGLGDDDIAVGGADSATGGSGDDVFTLDPTDTAADLNATIAGGETGEDLTDPANGGAGDVLDLGAVTAPVTVTLNANPESGTVNGLDADGTPDITFSEIEKVITGTGSDTVAGGTSTGPINVDTGDGNDSIATGTGNDTIAAGTGNDSVDAGAGNDTVDAGTGDDTVDAGAGNDTVAAGDGNDKVDGGAGNDSLGGGNGNDSLGGGDGNDTLDGGAGTDTLVGGNGNDVLNGGDGDDDIVVGAGDTANGGSGDDVFTVNPALTGNAPITIVGGETVEDLSDPSNGGAGDVLDLRGLTNVIVTPTGPEAGTVTYTNAGGQTVTINYSEIETILRDPAGTVDGTAGSDTMNPGYTDPQGDQVDGTDGLNDTIAGGAGNDVIDAGLGDDTAAGGVGNDTVAGNVGNDSLAGEGGNDSLDGGTGNDTLDGGADADTLKGGIGADSLVGGDGTDTLDGGDGNDTLSGDAGSDTLAGGTGNDTIDGGLGDDDIAVGGADSATGGSGDDVFTLDPTDTAADLNATIAGGETGEDLTDPANGGAGDVLDLGAVTAPVTVTLNANPESGTVNGLDADGTPDITFSEIEKVITGTGSDTVAGGTSTGPINVDTGDGNDSIATGTGNDTIAAGTGNDSVDAGAGNDTVDAGTGDDTVDAGAGDDTVAAGDGNDKVDGGAGNDSLGGGNGNDSLGGGDGNDTLDGGAGTDTLVGGNGNDVLNGGDGDDDIVVGAGDVANGGSGDDVFTVNPALTGNAPITIVGGETVEDLSDPSNGGAGDVLDLRGLTNVIVTPTGPEAGTVTYTNAGGQTVTINYSEIETILRDPAGTVDGTAGSDTMNPGYTDPQGDQVDGTDGLNDTIAGGAGNDVIDAGLGDDTAAGGVGNDTVAGNVGNDSLAGEGGNDSLDGGTGNDTLDGGADADTLKGGIGADSLVGGDGTDTLDGGDGNDTLSGDAGSDTLAGGLGNDTIDGGLGDDDIAVGGADSATGGSGDDVFTLDPTDTAADLNATIAGGETGEDLTDPANGGAGDVLDLGAVTAPVTVTLNANPESGTVNGLDADGTPDITFSEIEKVILGAGDDTVNGGGATGPVNLDGGDGNDSIATGSGNDTVAGGDGNDSIAGGAGNDSLAGGADNDTLDGGTGNDTLDGGTGDDSLTGGDGDDSVTSGTGNDTIYGGTGNDTVDAGDGDDFINTRTTLGNGIPNQGLTVPGNPLASYTADPTPNDDRDSITAGTGNDTVLSGDDNDTIYGGDGRDSIDAGFDDDLVYGGADNDSIAGNEGRDTIYAGAGDDTVFGALADTDPGFAASAVYDLLDAGGADPVTTNSTDLLYGEAGNDLVYGGEDADTVYGGVDNDTIYGGIDDDLLNGDEGNDRVFGDQGNDVLSGGIGNDSLDGGIGNDTLTGGTGSDTLVGGAGNDSLDGGADDDDIVIGAGDQALGGAGDDAFSIDPAQTGTAAITVQGGEADEGGADTANGGAGDVLDLTGGSNVQVVYNQLDPTWNGTTSESGTATYRNAANQDVTVTFSEIERVVVCFAGGTMIETAEGEVAIERLQVGDLVRTADHDYQPIRWIGSTKVAATGSVAPILIKAGALGNTRDLKVSPQHRMLLGGWQAEMLFGDDEVLVAAKHLVNDSTILREIGGEVEYFHMLFDTHEIVFAEGAPSESFHPGQVGWGALAEEAREEILALFPELASGDFAEYGTSARRTLKAHEATLAAKIVRFDDPSVAGE